jgi:hypothetical protein
MGRRDRQRGKRPGRSESGSNPVYILEGVALESLDGDAGRSVCTWLIVHGRVRDVDLSGLVLLAISIPPARPVVLVNEWATPVQVLAVQDLLGGRLGEVPHGFPSEGSAMYQVPIEYALEGGRGRVSVPGRLDLVVAGRADMSVDIPEEGLAWRCSGCAVVHGSFRLEAEASENPHITERSGR